MADTPTQQGGQQNIRPRDAALQQIAQAVHDQASEDLADFNEDSGEIIPNETQEADAPSVATEPHEAPVAEVKPKTLTIIVDGQPLEVEESRIIEAGRRTLQKDHAADKRLQEAAQLKRYYEAQLAQLQRPSGNPDAEPQNQAPSAQDAPQPTTIAIDPATLDRYMENKLYARDAQKAAEKFVADFPEIASDPHLMALAAQLEQRRLDTATALGESYGDPFAAYRKHGEALTEWRHRLAGTSPVATDKQERKRTITTIQTAGARAPAPKEDKPMTPAEQIEQMRLQRMQGRPVPARRAN